MTGTIVICNEERFVRWALSTHLTGSGYRVLEAKNVLDAQQIAQAHQADALLIDVGPYEEIKTIVHELKKISSSAAIVLFMNKDIKTLKDISFEQLSIGLVKKPFRLAEIDAILGKIIKKS